MESIIANPDYVGKNIKNGSIEFTKEYILNGELHSQGYAKKT